MKVKVHNGNLLKEVSRDKLSKIMENISTEKHKKTKDILKLMDVFIKYNRKGDILQLLEIK